MKYLSMTTIFRLGLLLVANVSAVQASDTWQGYQQQGQASFYADKFENRKTANGERYQHHLKTAAHKKLSMGTKVKVTNLVNNKSVTVKINDRGPFIKGRIIDLSKSAFQMIGDTRAGLLNVKIEVVK